MQEGLELVVDVVQESFLCKDGKLQNLDILAVLALDSLSVIDMLVARTIELLVALRKEVVVFTADHSDELVEIVNEVSCLDDFFKPCQMLEDIGDVIKGHPSCSSGFEGDHVLQLQIDEIFCFVLRENNL